MAFSCAQQPKTKLPDVLVNIRNYAEQYDVLHSDLRSIINFTKSYKKMEQKKQTKLPKFDLQSNTATWVKLWQ